MLRELGEEMRMGLLGYELDLNLYKRYAVEDRISFIIRQLYSDQALRNLFNLKGEIQFANHRNILSPEDRHTKPDVSSSQQSPVCKRQKSVNKDGDAVPETPTVRSRSSRPRADQFCVYNTGFDEAIPAYIIEYKAPHKLTKDIINKGLVDMDVDEVIENFDEGDPAKVARWRVAACISQIFSYMIQAGLEYGCVCTGETLIFLHVNPDDPTTVYYYLSVPNDDVGDTTSWIGGSDCDNKLHLTTIGQVLAFTLRALGTPPHDQDWRSRAEKVLKKWEITRSNIFGSDSDKSSDDIQPEYKHNRPSRNEYIRMSPVKTRSNGLVAGSSCRPIEALTNWDTSDDDSSGNDRDWPDSPSTQLPSHLSNAKVAVHLPKSAQGASNRQAGGRMEYCTQKCLLGLVNGGRLDENCPNVASHGNDGWHVIDSYKLLELARA
ncbi:uncharacterized protein GIQ15_05316 [Arthroderma uncinatum]|uniref:uncharacterized protein n=1 Tax=Arthroderma uncinatum TaxID=74035 RepID=UPI00144AAA75|nr:uncharacterized protein GIQ15_05316 [Arthroderma uncinatum]KAF3482557.1 hypothetical protein GIQ15_05316 [Arthroderma uncinatum]